MTSEPTMESELYLAAKAFRDLNAHYRIGKCPSDALFNRLKKAGKIMEKYESRDTREPGKE